MSSNQNIIPKDCSYGCNTRIYWDNSQSSFLELFSKQKHICKNRPVSKPSGNITQGNNTNTNRTSPFYSKKPYLQRPKIPMSNSIEVLQGTIQEVTKKYEILSDLITDVGGHTLGSQSHISTTNNTLSIVVYYSVPIEGNKRDEVKRKFANMIRSQMALQRN